MLAVIMSSRAVSTALTAALLLVFFDILWVIVVEREQPIGYFALTSALLLGPALFLGLVCQRASASPALVTACLSGLGAWLIWERPARSSRLSSSSSFSEDSLLPNRIRFCMAQRSLSGCAGPPSSLRGCCFEQMPSRTSATTRSRCS